MALLEVQDIVIRFGGVTAVAGVSFDVGERQICGLIGPNGAGKTTTFNCISGIYRPIPAPSASPAGTSPASRSTA